MFTLDIYELQTRLCLYYKLINTLSNNYRVEGSLCRGFMKFLCRRLVGFFSRAFLVFLMKGSKKRRRKLPGKLMSMCRSQPVHQSNVTKFPGVYFDEHLTWKYHINFVCKQIAKSVGILSRTRFYLSCKTKLMLYYTLIYPYITYCNSTWSSTYVSNLNRIYYLQKRAVRAVTNSDYRAHTAPLFSKLKILDIFQINTLDIAKFMFRYHNNLLPPLYLNLFMTNSQVHTYDTRTAGNYRMHSCHTNIKKFNVAKCNLGKVNLKAMLCSWMQKACPAAPVTVRSLHDAYSQSLLYAGAQRFGAAQAFRRDTL